MAALKERAVFVERLTGLGLVPESGASFMFLPAKVGGSTGGAGGGIAPL